MSSYPNKNVYTYKTYPFVCRKCGWEGLGSETIDLTDVINYYGANCPKCRALIEFISFPTDAEMLEYGTEEEKTKVRIWQAEEEFIKADWDEKRKKYPSLTSSDQLPDIDADEIIISLREEGEQSGIYEHEFIVLYWGEQELWRQHTCFEYYTTYLSMGKILKEKYGERLFDFEAEHTVDLGGDSLTAFSKVDNFRKTLKRWSSIIGWSVLVAKTTGRKFGLMHWNTPNRKTEWIDNLVLQNKATHIHNGRCPHTYHIKASDILPIIIDDDSLKAFVGKVGYGDIPLLERMTNKIFREDKALSECTPDEILRIELWDLMEIDW